MGELCVVRFFLVTLLAVEIFEIEAGVPFVDTPGSASDPKMVVLLRNALMHAGVSPDGIVVKDIKVKWELIRTKYRATYINNQGQTCFLHWSVNDFTGSQSLKMPICNNLATGTGNDPPRVRLPYGPHGGHQWY